MDSYLWNLMTKDYKMFKLKLTVSIIICIFAAIVFGFADERTVAILDFENNSLLQAEQYQPLSKGLAEIMITEMSQVQALHVVERRKLNSLLDELKLSQTGSVAGESTVQVGKLLGAQHLVFGGFIVDLNSKMRIDVRIIEVETGLTLKAEQVMGKADKVLDLVKKLSKKVLKDLDVRITKDEEKSLNQSEKVDIQAVMYFSKGLDFEDLGQWEKAVEYYKKALDLEPKFHQAKKRIQYLTEKEKHQ
jgi:TolB-like protein